MGTTTVFKAMKCRENEIKVDFPAINSQKKEKSIFLTAEKQVNICFVLDVF